MVEMTTVAGAVRFRVYAQPRAARTEVVGEHDGAVKIRVAAPPVDGEANTELVRFLAKLLKRPPSSVRVVGGESGRRKIVEVAGVDAESVRAGLGL